MHVFYFQRDICLVIIVCPSGRSWPHRLTYSSRAEGELIPGNDQSCLMHIFGKAPTWENWYIEIGKRIFSPF